MIFGGESDCRSNVKDYQSYMCFESDKEHYLNSYIRDLGDEELWFTVFCRHILYQTPLLLLHPEFP